MTKNAGCVYAHGSGDAQFLAQDCSVAAERAQVHCTIVVLLDYPRLEESNCNLSA